MASATPGEEERFGRGLLKTSAPAQPAAADGTSSCCTSTWLWVGALLRGWAGLGWRIPLNYFQMGINAANPVCRRMDKQTKAPLDAINKPLGCCLWPGAENIPVLAWGTGTRCLAALPALWPRGRGASDSSGMVTAGIPSGAGVARV